MSKIKLKANESGTGILTIEAPNTDTDKTLTLPTSDGTLVTTDGTTFTGNVNFGDSDKAIFGAGSDLQIYHTGSASVVGDFGTGDLLIRGENLKLQNTAGENYLTATNNDATRLYFDNAGKLATTSTGVDVTGSVVCDGLNVTDGLATLSTTSTGEVEQLRFRMSGTRQTGNKWGMYWSDNTNETNTAIWTTYEGGNNAGALSFGTNAGTGGAGGISSTTERVRINKNGNVLIGQTAGNTSASGTIITSSGKSYHIATSDIALALDRKTTDGAILQFRRDQTVVGIIGTYNSYITMGHDDTGLLFNGDADVIHPWNTSTNSNRDNIVDLGYSGGRFDDIYATNGTIQTSDQNEKQQIASLTDAEMNVAKRLSALFKTYKWNSAVEEKGDNARTHSGIIAQDMQQAFIDEGLDAGNYAMFISSTWWEKEISVDAVEAVEGVEATYDEEGNELTPAVEEVEGKDAYTYMDTKEEATEGYTERTRLGVRYPELFAFINAYNDQRFADLETRITALENA